MNRIKALIRKEWSEVFRNRFVFFTVSFMPLIFTALPLGILYTMRGSGAEAAALGLNDTPAEMAQLCGDLTGAACAQYFILAQFIILFLIMPVMIPVTIASYSVVGEKTTSTLEPLLATPISTVELLAGKALAAVIPAIVITLVSFGIFAAGTAILATDPVVVSRVFSPLWLLAILVIGPLASVAAVSLALMVSSRTNEPRVAEQLSGLVILPIVALFVAQISGFFFINERLVLWISLALLLADIGLVYFAAQLFQRETILTRWK